MSAQSLLKSHKFITVHGIWGSNALRQDGCTIYSLGQGPDYLRAPNDSGAETCLWISQGHFDPNWVPENSDGPPLTIKGEFPDTVSFIFPNLASAMVMVNQLAAAKPTIEPLGHSINDLWPAEIATSR